MCLFALAMFTFWVTVAQIYFSFVNNDLFLVVGRFILLVCGGNPFISMEEYTY